MNDRAVSVLDAYDLEVLSTSKGRGAILCETSQGMKILKEYTGSREKLELQEALLLRVKEQGQVLTEQLVRNREGELLTADADQVRYIVKDYFGGRECNRKDWGECRQAVRTLAKLHEAMRDTGLETACELPCVSLWEEFSRHNRELKKVRKYILQKGQKSFFERYLLQNFDLFLEQAFQIEEELSADPDGKEKKEAGTYCHGDYQYHNLLYGGGRFAVINFEKLGSDSQMKDLYLFLRKLLEKNNWPLQAGMELLQTYGQARPLSGEDKKQLYYRFAYPEKFWKIVNFYYNSGKAWIPDKNQEKLEKLLNQEKEHTRFVDSLREL